MKRLLGVFTTLALVLGTGVIAHAQTGERVLEQLGDLLRGGGQQMQGYVVAVRDADIVVRGRDNRSYAISTADVDRRVLTRLHPGKPVRISLKRGTGDALVATAIEPESGEQRTYRTVSGVVQSTSGNQVQVRTNEGFTASLDLSQIVGPRPTLRQGDTVTLTYEAAANNANVVVWAEPGGGTFGAASPSTTAPTGTMGGGYERIHGFVESVGIGTLTLKADDGRTMMVDVSNSRGSANDVRPGDLVNVVGRSTGDRFVAEVVQKN